MTQEPALAPLMEADLWRVLGVLFDIPTPNGMAMVQGTSEELGELLEGEQLGLLLREISKAAAHTNTTELEHIFHWLFTTNMLATPYEGPYCATERGGVLGDLSAFYQAFGFSVNEHGGSPDSIVHEVKFLSLLALKEAFALQNGLTEEAEICANATKGFIEDHLGRWSPHFVNKVLTATEEAIFVLAVNLLTAALSRVGKRVGVTEIVPLPFLDLDQEKEVGTVACPASPVVNEDP